MSGVEIRVRANTKPAQRELSRLERSVQNLDERARGVSNAFKVMAATITGAFAAKGLTTSLIRAGDAVKNLENQISLVTGRGPELANAVNQVVQIANRSRVPINTAATTFNRFGLALEGTGVSAKGLQVATEAVQQAAIISGATAETASASIMQLGQGLASGELRGEELNSVLEGIPRLARAIADGMGVPFGKLRELAKDGQLDTTTVFNAIIKEAQNLDSEFNTLDATVSQLGTVLKNNLTIALGEVDKAFGFSESAAAKLMFLNGVVQYVGQNVGKFVASFSLGFDILLIDIKYFVFLAKQLLSDLFTGAITGEELAILVDMALAKAKEKITNTKDFVINFVVTGLERVEEAVPVLGRVLRAVRKFGDDVIKKFKEILDKIITNSYWTDLIDGTANSIGGSRTYAVLNTVKDFISNWASAIVVTFEALRKNAINRFEELRTKVSDTTGFQDGVITVAAYDIDINPALNTIERLKLSLRKAFTVEEDLGSDGPSQGTVTRLKTFTELLEDTGQGISDLGSRAYINTQELINSLIGIGQNRLEIGQQGLQNLKDFGKSIAETVKEGILFDLDVLNSAINLLVVGALLQKLPTTRTLVTLTGLVFFATTDAFDDNIRSVGRGFGKLIREGFESEGGATGLVNDIFKQIFDAFKNLGEGLSQGIFGIEVSAITPEFASQAGSGLEERFKSKPISTNLTEFIIPKEDELKAKLVTALGAITAVFSLGLLGVPGLSFATKAFGKALMVTLSGGMTVAKILGAELILALASSELVGETAAWRKNASKLGQTIGKAIRGGIILGLTVLLADEIGDTLSNLIRSAVDKYIQIVKRETASEQSERRAEKGLEASDGNYLAQMIGTGAIRLDELSSNTLKDVATKLSSTQESFADFGDLFRKGSALEEAITDLNQEISKRTDLSEEDKATLLKSMFDIGKFFDALSDGVVGPNKISDAFSYTRQANGGYISGPGGPTDDKIPALLSNGEFVVRASSVKKYGQGFLSAINAGAYASGGLVRRFANGSGAGPVPTSQAQALTQRTLDLISGNIAAISESGLFSLDKVQDTMRKAIEMGDFEAAGRIAAKYGSLSDIVNGVKDLTTLTEEQKKLFIDAFEKGGESGTAKAAENASSNFVTEIKRGLVEGLKTGDFKAVGEGLLDTFTTSILESSVSGLVDSLLDADTFKSLFKGSSDFGKGIGNLGNKGIDKALGNTGEEATGFSGLLKDLFGGLTKGFGSLLQGLTGSLGSLFGGGTSGGGGGLGSLISAGLKLFNFNSGGIVPSTPYSRVGMDSVPAMLTPGEMVIPANRVKSMNNNNSNSSVVNLSITGDISRQTRREIVSMLPQITQGVNANNKERNFKYG